MAGIRPAAGGVDSPGLGYQGSLFLQSGVPHRSRAGGSTPDCLPRWPQHAPLQGLSPDGRRHPATHPSRSRRRGCRTAHSPPETAEKARSNRKSHKLRPPPAEWSPQARSAPSRKPAVPAAPEAGQTRKQHTGQTLGRSGCLGDHCCVLPGLPEARGLLRLQRPVLCAWLGDWSSAKSFPEKRKALNGDHRARTGLLESTLRRVHAHTARHTHRLAAAHSHSRQTPPRAGTRARSADARVAAAVAARGAEVRESGRPAAAHGPRAAWEWLGAAGRARSSSVSSAWPTVSPQQQRPPLCSQGRPGAGPGPGFPPSSRPALLLSWPTGPSPCSLRPQAHTVPPPDVLLGCALGLGGKGGVATRVSALRPWLCLHPSSSETSLRPVTQHQNLRRSGGCTESRGL